VVAFSLGDLTETMNFLGSACGCDIGGSTYSSARRSFLLKLSASMSYSLVDQHMVDMTHSKRVYFVQTLVHRFVYDAGEGSPEARYDPTALGRWVS